MEGMGVYDFSLILASPPEHQRVAKVSGVHLASGPRSDERTVAVHREAPSLAEAVVSAIGDLEAVNLQPVRVCDRDWLTLADIATRIGRSREIVRLWSIGRQGPGGFPPPLNPGCDTRFYSWIEVSHWLRRRMGHEVPNSRLELAVANLLLQARCLASRIDNREPFSALLAPFSSGSATGVVQPLSSPPSNQSRSSTPTPARSAAA